MIISDVIVRLRTVLSSWSNRIYGAAEYEAVEDKARLPLPAMYVSYAGSTARTLSNSTFLQEMDERVRVLVVIAQADRTGKTAQDQIHTIRAAIFSALLNYPLNADAHTLEFVSDSMLEIDKARYFHMFEFRQISRLDTEDGAALALDDFNNLYADWNLTESDESNHPDAQDNITDIYNA